MQVILRTDVDGLGKRGDIVDVADGHARNFLLPKGKAIKASDGAIEQAAKMRKARDLRDASDREAAQTVASALVPKVISIAAKSHDGKLFGSIQDGDIVAAVSEQTGIDLDRKVIDIAEPIRELGQHTVTAALHTEVSFPITIEVIDEE